MKEFIRNSKLMGSAFQLAVVLDDETTANEMLNLGIDEIKRIEQLFSEFLPNSETSKINNNAYQEAVEISPECFDLIQRSLSISKLSKGCFDITVGPLKKIYNFKNQFFEMPTLETVSSALMKVGYQYIELKKKVNAPTIRFKKLGMKISFAAIGKGYASDCVMKLWKEQNVKSGYVNASGDLAAFGKRADGTAWNIGIANPDKINGKTEMLFNVPVENACVATSGDYEQYFTYKNERYSHNIHPITGLPLKGIKSVSIFSPSAELSDALATAVYVKGVTEGMAFVNQLPETHAIVIDQENQLVFSNEINYEVA